MEEFQSLLIIMVVVWVMGKLFRTLTLPVVFGELLGGILVGPYVLGIVNPESITIKVLAELGIFFLMLHSGLETDPKELYKGSKKSILIALGGVIIPFLGGLLITQNLNFTLQQSLFISTAISATAIAITVRILKDYKLHKTTFGHTILAAAIISDIIILITFSTIINLVDNGNLNISHILFMLLKVILFFSIVIYFGIKAQKYIKKFFRNKGFTLTLIIALSFGFIAEWIGLHMIIGAFLAGLFIHEEIMDEKVYNKIEDRIYGLSYGFIGPIFFTCLAFNLDFSGISNNISLFIIIFLIAFLGKFIGSFVGAILQKVKFKKSLMIGLTMNSRGAIDLVIISIGLQRGIIGKDIFSILITVAFTATLITVLFIRPLKKHLKFRYV